MIGSCVKGDWFVRERCNIGSCVKGDWFVFKPKILRTVSDLDFQYKKNKFGFHDENSKSNMNLTYM